MKFADSPFTMADIGQMAKELGLIRALGTYNGQPYWRRPNHPAIITPQRVLLLAGYPSPEAPACSGRNPPQTSNLVEEEQK